MRPWCFVDNNKGGGGRKLRGRMRDLSGLYLFRGSRDDGVGDKIARSCTMQVQNKTVSTVYLTVSPCLCGFGGGCWLAVVWSWLWKGSESSDREATEYTRSSNYKIP